ncbi:ranaspumin-like isoform X2 [Eleutherodactylus coqui]|uniref:ranaspumin-like isoform X2 n=1 Tax=Eleutherodactylus coqui TaxID=57060 RepID=UPI00346376EF
MKIIIFFMLAGVSLAQDDVIGCLKKAAEQSPEFLMNLRKFVCDYKRGKITDPQNEENYDAASKNLIEAMSKTGCAAGEIFGTKSYEEAFRKAGTDGKELIRDFLARNMDEIEVSGLVTDAACTALDAPGGVASG